MNHMGFLIDMDGVLYRGDMVIPGALEFLESIRGHPHLFLTNNSSATTRQVVKKLRTLGLPRFRPEQILTSATATAEHLNEQEPGFRYYAVGGPGLHASLQSYGMEDDNDPDFVVIGEGEGLDYETLTTGINLLLKGKARLIGTNPDANLDGTRDGRHVVLPGCGALIAPFQVATGLAPQFVGKPNPLIFRQALNRLQLEPHRVFMIGDRPDTDIRGAGCVGIHTILVRTGRLAPWDPYPEGEPLPEIMVNSLAELSLPALQELISPPRRPEKGSSRR